MKNTIAFMSTHILTKGVISEYKKLSNTSFCDVILLVDDTYLKIKKSNYIETHNFYGTNVKCLFIDFPLHETLSLPSMDQFKKTNNFSQIMWYNGDYRFYYVKKFFPEYQYYWQFEYDVFCNSDSYSFFFDKYKNKYADLLVCKFRKEEKNGKWVWSKNVDWIYGDSVSLYGSFFPVCRLKNEAIEFLCNKRRTHHELFLIKKEEEVIKRWIHCELFVPTELMNNGFKCKNINEENIHLDEFDLNEDRFFEKKDGKLYHPVKGNFLQRIDNLKASFNKFSIGKYFKYKILSKITFGNTRKKYKEKYKEQKILYRAIRNI